MKIYLYSSFLLKEKDKILSYIDEKSVTFNIVLEQKTHYYFINKKLNKSNISSISWYVPIDKLSLYLVRLANKLSIKLVVLVDHKLNLINKLKIKKFKIPVLLYDNSSSLKNIKFYKENTQIIYQSANESNIEDAISWQLGCVGQTNYSCSHSSCLGKILFIDKKGNIFFCPKHLDKSKLGNLYQLNSFENIFDNDCFIQTLKTSIEKRKKCIKSCVYFNLCKSGCCFEKIDCEAKITLLNKTIELINECIKNPFKMDKLKIYQKDSIIRRISGILSSKD